MGKLGIINDACSNLTCGDKLRLLSPGGRILRPKKPSPNANGEFTSIHHRYRFSFPSSFSLRRLSKWYCILQSIIYEYMINIVIQPYNFRRRGFELLP
jgi:hypothetical protein